MAASGIPEYITAAIKRCWPAGIVEEFDTDESYFHQIRSQLEWDLRKIRGASLLWQTEEQDRRSGYNDREDKPPTEEWQSYHVFFLAPNGKEFRFEDQTDGVAELTGLEGEELPKTVIPGEGWFGLSVGISLAARFAVINPCHHSQYEDGSVSFPDVESFIYRSASNR